jgi:hypothetical protein
MSPVVSAKEHQMVIVFGVMVVANIVLIGYGIGKASSGG